MRKSKKNAPLHEALRNLWKIRIMLEKSYTETCATWMAQRIESLADFRRDYDITRVTSNIAFWDVELQAWKTFQLENFLEWSPVC